MLDKYRKLIAEEPDNIASEDAGMVPSEISCGLPDYPSQAAILEQAGVGFGEDISMLIQKSLRRLAKVSGAKTLKFFGKILGSGADYWVAQGTLPGQDEPIKSAEQEKRGEGVNATVFWVTNKLYSDWIQLPDA